MDDRKKDLVTAMSIKMRVEITAYQQGLIQGTLYSNYLEEPYVFVDLLKMISKMEEVFDTTGFPQAFLSPRSFKGGKLASKKHQVEGSVLLNQSEQPNQVGNQCTFEVAVRFRQNATWQGQILWAEKNIKQNFRSVLEMIKLMDEALNDSADGENSKEWSDAK